MQSVDIQDPITVHKNYENTVPVEVLNRQSFESETEFRRNIDSILEDYRQILNRAKQHQLGYPIYHVSEGTQDSEPLQGSKHADIDFAPLEKVQNYYINNVGSPDISTSFASNSHAFEMGVLHWFAELWNIDNTESWGYITNGGTESNIQSLYIARENFPDAVAYASKDAHFSVFKACNILRVPVEVVDTTDRGEMRYDHVRRLLEKNRGRPAIVILTCGTTMTGAIDQPSNVVEILHQAGYRDDEYFIHVDAALSGIFLPLLEDQGAPQIHFKIPGVSSISCSGHKFLGVPIPCGIMMIRKKYIERIGNTIEYIASKDLTLTCSRNGHASLYVWLMLTELGKDGIRYDAQRCIQRAQHVQERIHSAGIECWVNPFSITVVFEKPEDVHFTHAWQLACQGDVCHIIVMPHIRDATLDTFVSSLVSQKPHVVHRKDLQGIQLPQRDSCYYNVVSYSTGDGSSSTC